MKLIKILNKLYYIPSATLNTAANINIKTVNRLLANIKSPVLLNIGSGDRFLGGSSLGKNDLRLINLDITPLSSADVLGDAQQLPFADAAFNGIICQAVLEHVPYPQKVVAEMYRVLKQGGIIYIEVPFLQGYHPSPGDFYRYTLEGLEVLLADFSKMESGVCVGPASTVCWVAREFLSGLLCGFSEKRFFRRITVFIAGWLTFPIKYLDLMLAGRRNASHIASGIYYLGSKG